MPSTEGLTDGKAAIPLYQQVIDIIKNDINYSIREKSFYITKINNIIIQIIIFIIPMTIFIPHYSGCVKSRLILCWNLICTIVKHNLCRRIFCIC